MTPAEKKARFAALEAQHRADLGVAYSIGPMFGPWTVISLRRLGGRANTATKGNGAKALYALTALADEMGVKLTLGTSRQRLVPILNSSALPSSWAWATITVLSWNAKSAMAR